MFGSDEDVSTSIPTQAQSLVEGSGAVLVSEYRPVPDVDYLQVCWSCSNLSWFNGEFRHILLLQVRILQLSDSFYSSWVTCYLGYWLGFCLLLAAEYLNITIVFPILPLIGVTCNSTTRSQGNWLFWNAEHGVHAPRTHWDSQLCAGYNCMSLTILSSSDF